MKERLRIGLLVDSHEVSAWAYKMVQLIAESNHSKIVLTVRRDSKNVQKLSAIEKIKKNRKKILHIFFKKFENKIHRVTPNAFESKSIEKLINCPEIAVSPIESKFSDVLSQEDITSIKEHQVDVFIRLGFKILRGDILNSAKHGVWSFHHGDNSINRGGPPGLWEVFEGWGEVGAVLQILTEDLDGGVVLGRTYSKSDLVSVNRNCNNYFWNALSLLPRKLKELHDKGEELFFREINKQNVHPKFYSNRLFVAPTNIEVLKYFCKLYSSAVVRKIESFFYLRQWVLLFRIEKVEGLSKTFYRFKKILPPLDRFWADPFVIQRGDRYYVFLEEVVYAKGKGVISVLEVNKNGEYTQPKTVLETDYHLSYPFLIEDKGDLYMIPETSENRTIELYKCTKFPDQWSKINVLMNNVEAVDATVFYHGGKYWLFCNMKENEGASNLDELFLFYSDNLVSENWVSHPQNPIVSDVKKSRPAGKLFIFNERIYRPSQNSKKRYGYGMKIHEVIALSETTYQEVEVDAIYPNWSKEILSTHTLNSDGCITVADALISRRKF